MHKSNPAWVYLAAIISLVGLAIHIGAILGGADWYHFFGAPRSVVESARSGTLLAPVAAAIIAALIGLCAAYSPVRRLPLLRLMMS